MRVRTRSACVVLAWGILLLLTAGSPASARPAPANNRTAGTTSTSTSTSQTTHTQPTLTSNLTSPASRATGSPAADGSTGLPRWLAIVLLAAAVLIATAFVTELVLAIGRRRRKATPLADHPATYPADGPAACPPPPNPRILLADYDRLVVTASGPDGTVCVLRPPGADPEIILLAARLVLPQDRYEQLAGHLGMTSHGQRE
jgi:hypothetical protein